MNTGILPYFINSLVLEERKYSTVFSIVRFVSSVISVFFLIFGTILVSGAAGLSFKSRVSETFSWYTGPPPLLAIAFIGTFNEFSGILNVIIALFNSLVHFKWKDFWCEMTEFTFLQLSDFSWQIFTTPFLKILINYLY